MTYYGKREFVQEAVASVLANTFTDFELLVVDDASTDGGLDLIKAFGDLPAGQVGPRIRILESAVNTGRAAAANRGFDAALGEYVAILDADDVMHPERLAKQVAYMDAHPEIGALGTYADILGTGANMSAYQLTDRSCKGTLLLGDPMWYGAAMFRRSVLDENGIRCDTEWRLPGMDHLLLLHVARVAGLANLSEQLTSYRLGEQNMRHGRDPHADRIALYHRVFQLFEIRVSEAEVRLHIMLQGLFKGPVSKEDVRALRAWIDRLITLNRSQDLFPADVLELSLEERWDRLFHTFADRGWATGMAHMSCSRSFPISRMYYLLKVHLRSSGDR